MPQKLLLSKIVNKINEYELQQRTEGLIIIF